MPSTTRLYHEHPTLTEFEARVLRSEPGDDGSLHVVLDQTAFYPTGGGQPHDIGYLQDAPVLDVWENGEEVVHRIDGTELPEAVSARVDWDRRVDHRQQHTGQHILSRAFELVLKASTIGFHLGSEKCTIDLDQLDLSPQKIIEVEDLANRIVTEDHEVRQSWHKDVSELPESIRKSFEAEGDIRLISIGEFDVNPCCGTHCERSGQVGLIKVLKLEKNKNGTRVEFVCGRRALQDYRARHEELGSVARDLTTDALDVRNRVEALRSEHKETRSRLEKADKELRQLLTQAWAEEARKESSSMLVKELDASRQSWMSPLA
ncbi:MAG: alanyl-tRNA editing protein, partial [Candidatus Eisenbacteria bacterium]|nr:alanyl-tRNA editing protein [Candidatus Eisenbacteria bacterium]